VRLLLEDLLASEGAETTHQTVVVETLDTLPPHDLDAFNDSAAGAAARIAARHPYVLRVDDGGLASEDALPLVVAGAEECPPDATYKLLIQLGRAVRTARETSLGACMRLRASGPAPQLANGGLAGTVRFEIVLPRATFSFVRIRDVPVLATALSAKLSSSVAAAAATAASPSSSSPSAAATRSIPVPKIGYLTLNQTRKAVPLLESDPAISLAPIVGVWTAFHDGGEHAGHIGVSSRVQHGGMGGHLRSPLTWAACVRFMHNAHIKERVFVDHDATFLLLHFGPTGGAECYEVTAVAAPAGDAALPPAVAALGEVFNELGTALPALSRAGTLCHCKGTTRTYNATRLTAVHCSYRRRIRMPRSDRDGGGGGGPSVERPRTGRARRLQVPPARGGCGACGTRGRGRGRGRPSVAAGVTQPPTDHRGALPHFPGGGGGGHAHESVRG